VKHLALGLKYEFETSKHSNLIGWFNKNFINKGLVDNKFGKTINRAFLRRTKGDYDIFISFSNEDIKEMLSDSISFINIIQQILNSENF